MFASGYSFSSSWGEPFHNNKYTGAHYDYSYELNDALWDDFYMSTLLPANSGGAVEFPADGVLPKFPADGVLPNARIHLWSAEADDDDLLVSTKSAAKLVLDGGFNINSTSVAAWEAVLGALRDVSTLGAEPDDGNLRHNFSRFSEPLLGPTSDTPSYGQSNELTSAYRSLTDRQINLLAESIVKEIRTRRSAYGHPFLSMSEFINRSINDEDIDDPDRQRFAYNGALQFAIDQSTINGEPALDEFGEPQAGGTGIWKEGYIGALPGNTGPYVRESLKAIENRGLFEAAPGALTQADVLAKIGSLLMPRSDTFTIRSYGEAAPSVAGNAGAQAYLELTVQRTPEYLVHSDGAAAGGDEPFASPPSEPLNQQFGRRYEIIASRWIYENEI